jgi:acetyltransferase-like isoleucine patch superfamily enzyme
MIRAWMCRGFFASAGGGINVESGIFVASGRHVSLGSSSGFGTGSRVYGADIGANVIVGPHVVLLKDNHRYDDPSVPIQSHGHYWGPGPLSRVTSPSMRSW